MTQDLLRLRLPAHHLERARDHARVHACRWQGPGDGPVLVCVHGLGGSHLNWSLLAPRLAARHGTVWALDLAGFGHTPPGERGAALEGNVDLLCGFVRTISPGRPVVLVGNSFGGLLACSLAGRHPELVAGLVLVGPAVPPSNGWPEPRVIARFGIVLTPGLGRAWLRHKERWLTPAEQVREALEFNTSDADRVEPAFVRAQITMAAQRRKMPHARRAQLSATRTMLGRLGPLRRRLWADMAAVSAPTLVLQGECDRLVDERTVRAFVARRSDWTYRVYPGAGHVVMVEDPARVADDIAEWLARHVERPDGARLDTSA